MNADDDNINLRFALSIALRELDHRAQLLRVHADGIDTVAAILCKQIAASNALDETPTHIEDAPGESA